LTSLLFRGSLPVAEEEADRAKVKTSKSANGKPKAKAKPPEEPLYKHPQAIRAHWVGQAKQAWYLVLTKEGKALGWTPTKLQEAMNSVGIVHFVHANRQGQITLHETAAPGMVALGYPRTPKGTVIAFYEYENQEFSNGDFGIQT
jgi:hypothetical protein